MKLFNKGFTIIPALCMVFLAGCTKTARNQPTPEIPTKTSPAEKLPTEDDGPYLHFDIIDQLPTPEQSRDPFLKFDIELDKNIYSANDDFTITFLLKSTNPDDMVVNKRFSMTDGRYGELDVVFRSHNMLSSFPSDAPGIPLDTDYIILHMGETIRTERKFKRIGDQCISGACDISAFYFSKFEPSNPQGLTVWNGELTSNTVVVQVQP
jgi:hypothetical protein